MAGTDLVVQLGAKLDNFEQGMDRAVGLAESAIGNIQSQFDNLNPTVGAGFVAAGIVGAIGGMSALLTFASKVNRELSEMDKTARQVGLSVERFQSIRFAANVKGVSNNDFADGLQKASGLLADAQRNTNTLGQLFTANGLKITDTNGRLISTNGLLANAATLINRAASEQDKIKIAQMLGLTREWVPVLEKGAEAFTASASEAERLGIVIQQSTIDKAKKFDEEWTKASVSLSTQIKAATADAAVYLSELIDQAGRYVTAVNESRGLTPDSGQSKFNAIADAIDISRKAAAGLAQDLEQVTRALDRALSKTNPDQEVISYLRELQAEAKASADELAKANAARGALLGASSEAAFPNGVPLPTSRPRRPSGPTTIIPAKSVESEGRDAFDSTEEQITKRTAALNADTIAVSRNNAVQAQLRAEFQLLNAIRKDEGEVTQTQIDQYTRLRASMSAEQALKEAAINLTPAHKASFIAAAEGAATATAAYDRARDAVNQVNSASQQFGSALSSGIADAVVEFRSLNDVASSFLKTIARASINNLVGSFFNAPSSGGLSTFASLLGGIGRNADGTDDWRGGLSLVGERGPELVNLPRGAQVIPNDILRGGGNSPMSISYAPSYDARGASVDAVARLEQLMARDRAEFEGRVITTVQKARGARVRGI